MGRHSVASHAKMEISARLEHGSLGRIVAVGDVEEWENQGNSLPVSGDITFMAFEDLDESSLAIHQPEVIYSPVLARNFDCIEMAMLLQNLGFSGTYRAVGQGLPKPELIEREVRQITRWLKFEIVQV